MLKPTTSQAFMKFVNVRGLGQYLIGRETMSLSNISDVLTVQYSGKSIKVKIRIKGI